ncbi:MAG: hypothetical protein Q8877_02660 [Sweet potato little leaf phytoplasma]|nr:hypothetical protein [Sweet potato little leaf phytoplasma]
MLWFGSIRDPSLDWLLHQSHSETHPSFFFFFSFFSWEYYRSSFFLSVPNFVGKISDLIFSGKEEEGGKRGVENFEFLTFCCSFVILVVG